MANPVPPCAPPGSSPLSSIGPVYSPCEMLPHLRGALYELLAGKSRVEIAFADQRLRFHPANIGELRAEIRKLEALCTHGGRAVQWGHRNPVGYGHGFGSGMNQRYR